MDRFRAGGKPAALLAVALVAAACGKTEQGCSGTNLARGGALRVVRGPQLGRLTQDSVLIAWLSSAPAVGAVEYGVDPGFGIVASDPSAATEHVITLTELVPGTLHFYRILLNGAVASEGHTFTTAASDLAAPFRFAVFGDSGSGTRRQLEVAAGVLAAGVALGVITGDVIYERGCPGEIDPRYFEPYANLIDHVPFYSCLGNHDVRTRNGEPLLEALYLPTNDQDGTERFYSFDHGNAHFIALDSNTIRASGDPQQTWLDADLAATSATWRFVYFHHPPFSSSSHGSSLGIRESLGPFLDAHGVDIVFNGHDHDYERTFPLAGGQVVDAASDPDYLDPGGTIYIVTGGGGRSLYPSGTSFFTAFSQSSHHFLQVDVDGPALTVQAIRVDGVVIDTLTITKTGG